ncbi:hypothetical protein G6F55_014326 [Rhizopus delemar]|nr:hypothetical protein G6F55_014326 [Rhizopus delemar]
MDFQAAAVGGAAHDGRAACPAGAGGAVRQHRRSGGAVLVAVHHRHSLGRNHPEADAARAGGCGAAGRPGDHPAVPSPVTWASSSR